MGKKKNRNSANFNSLKNAHICLCFEDLVGLIGIEVAKAVQTTTVNLITRPDFDQIKETTDILTDLKSSKELLDSFGDDSFKTKDLDAQDAYELQQLKSECLKLKSTLAKVNDTIERSCLEAQKLRDELSSLKENHQQKINELQKETKTLIHENKRIKLEMEERTAEIIGMQAVIDLMEKDQLKLDDIENLLVVKDLEEKFSQMLAENLELNDLKMPKTDESFEQNLKLAEEFFNLKRTEYPSDKDKMPAQPVEVSSYDKRDSIATFSYTIEHFHMLKDLSNHHSPPIYLGKLRWEIKVERYHTYNIYFTLICNDIGESPNWSCYVTGELRLKCHKPGAKSLIIKRFGRMFNITKNFELQWLDLPTLLHPDNGYVENNSITLEIHLNTE